MPRTVSNPPNPWESTHVEWLGEPPAARLEVLEERARTVLSRNDSPDVPFRWGVNPYRGCQHACAYCYARPSHQYLGFGAGTDFDKRIVVKTNAPECLARELAKKRWRGEPITFSGNTDCYQPLEASYELTRGCLSVCLARRNPVAVLTKSALVQRDLDLLVALHERARAKVFLSIPFLDARTCRAIEPGAPTPDKRFETLRALSEAGLETGIAIAPVIPGLSDQDVPGLLERAREAGARRAFLTLLRLPREVRPVFEERVAEAFPDREQKIRHALEEMRAGQARPAAFGTRLTGTGARWQLVRRLFEVHAQRLGIEIGDAEEPLRSLPIDEGPREVQGSLFGEDT